MSDEELIARVKEIALSQCAFDNAVQVTETLEPVFSKELMHTLAGIFIKNKEFCGCALPSFIAGAYAAIVLRNNNKALNELEELWRKS